MVLEFDTGNADIVINCNSVELAQCAERAR